MSVKFHHFRAPPGLTKTVLLVINNRGMTALARFDLLEPFIAEIRAAPEGSDALFNPPVSASQFHPF